MSRDEALRLAENMTTPAMAALKRMHKADSPFIVIFEKAELLAKALLEEAGERERLRNLMQEAKDWLVCESPGADILSALEALDEGLATPREEGGV